MVGGYWRIVSVAVLISFVNGKGIFHSRDENMYESKLIMDSLEEALKYLKHRQESVTGDVILGVLLAKANLEWIYKRLKYYFVSSSWHDRQLEQLLSQCHDLVLASEFKNYPLLGEILWANAAEDLKYGFLNEHEEEFLLQDFDSCRSIDMYLMRGSPEDSDFCINELLTSKCEVSEYCWLSEVNGDSHSGYKTSHRLLYFQVASKLDCHEINPRKFLGVKAIKNKLCQQMLLEAAALFEKPTVSVTRDIFMEQIALCGLEGFEEFAPANWRSQVRKWQSYNGCFGLGMRFENCSGDSLQKGGNEGKMGSATEICHAHRIRLGEDGGICGTSRTPSAGPSLSTELPMSLTEDNGPDRATRKDSLPDKEL